MLSFSALSTDRGSVQERGEVWNLDIAGGAGEGRDGHEWGEGRQLVHQRMLGSREVGWPGAEATRATCDTDRDAATEGERPSDRAGHSACTGGRQGEGSA